MQDAVPAGSPNRAFWSIAIEAQLCVLLPLLLLIIRRASVIAMVATVSAVVLSIGVLGPHLALMNDALIKFTPDLALLFAIGVLTSGILTASERIRSRPWAWYAVAASAVRRSLRAAVTATPRMDIVAACNNCPRSWPGSPHRLGPSPPRHRRELRPRPLPSQSLHS